MLKSFMQPSTTSTPKPDAHSRAGHPAYAPGKPDEAPKPAEAVKPQAAPEPAQSTPAEEGSKLIVGPNIKLKGSEITDCEILVVEGRVEASMKSRVIRIAEGGVFSGKAEIDVAEVHGNFEGDLTARKRLVIHSTGKVTGTIRYGAMMVEEGGSIAGDVATLAGAAGVAKAAETAAQVAIPQPVQEKASEPEQIQSSFARNQAARRQG